MIATVDHNPKSNDGWKPTGSDLNGIAAFAIFLFVVSMIIDKKDYNYGFMAVEDAISYFNYYNNFSDPKILFFYAGYAPVLPELVAYSVSGLPFIAQSAIYAIVSLSAGAFMCVQMARTLQFLGTSKIIAIAGTALCAAYLHIVCQNFYLNLILSMWPGLIGATFYCLRTFIMGGRSSAWSFAASLLSVLSHPLSFVILPLLIGGLVFQRRRKKVVLLLEGFALSFAAALFLVLTIRNAVNVPDLPQYLDAYRHWFISLATPNLRELVRIHLALAITIFGLGVAAWEIISFARKGLLEQAFIRGSIAYCTVSFAVMYLFSERFTDFKTLEDRYLTPGVAFAATILLTNEAIYAVVSEIVARTIKLLSIQFWRVTISAISVFCFITAIVWFVKIYYERLAFLVAAQCVRNHGLPDATVAAQPINWSLAILGQPRIGGGTTEGSEFLRTPANPELIISVCPMITPANISNAGYARIYTGKSLF